MENVQAVIVPHAGYVFSGVTAASAFAAINPDAEYEHIFLLGPSHHVYLEKASVNIGVSAYATPLGNVPVDTALCKDLMERVMLLLMLKKHMRASIAWRWNCHSCNIT